MLDIYTMEIFLGRNILLADLSNWKMTTNKITTGQNDWFKITHDKMTSDKV
jgi:hypothetical protein